MIQEFKQFISKGNVVDLAVGVIIGGAFGKIVTSLVNDIMMPLIGVLIGGIHFSGLSFKVGDSVILYGSFIQNVIDFLIIAICIFVFVKFVNRVMKQKKEDTKKEKKIEKAEEIVLLEEIRDLLKKQINKKKN
ncbi:MAG: large-conductance mechanosensitive channel protein MscL [bacterium]|nr:large-conductance mechanosensitive channel protein MscL [bacterium]